MRQMIKRMLVCVLAAGMVLGLLPMTTVQAATRNMTMYVGETVLIYSGKTITKISTSNSKALQARRQEPDHIHATLVASAVGKSKVTMKTKTGTSTINVTVKKPDFSVKVLKADSSDSYVYLAVNNKSTKFFEQVLLAYTIKDKSGEILKEDTMRIFNVPAKTITPVSLYLDVKDVKSVELSGISVKVVGMLNDARNCYVDVSSKMKVNLSNKFEKSTEISYQLSWSNTSKQPVSMSYYALVYNSKNQLIAMTLPTYVCASAGQNNISSAEQYRIVKPKGYHHYKLVKSAYYVKSAPDWT